MTLSLTFHLTVLNVQTSALKDYGKLDTCVLASILIQHLESDFGAIVLSRQLAPAVLFYFYPPLLASAQTYIIISVLGTFSYIRRLLSYCTYLTVL